MEDSTAATGRSDIEESRDLESLTVLWGEGVLDEQEYNAAKARLLQAQRDKLLESAGVSEQERSGWKWSSDAEPVAKLAVIEYKDLAQEVCASGMLAAGHVLEVMGRGASAQQQASGCAALSLLAERDATRAEIVGKGAVAAVVAAMAAHPDDAAVQEKGCSALSNCAVGDGEAEVRSKGLDLVLAAMEAHRGACVVQVRGCRALANCAFSPEGEADVLARRGAEAAVAAMAAHPAERQAQEEAADALSNLAGSDAGRAALLVAGALESAQAARERHPRCESVADLLRALS